MNFQKKFSIQTYNIGFITKSIHEIMQEGIKRGDIHWMKHRYKDRFFADPFLFTEDDEYYYILVEEYLFWEEKGIITLLKVERATFRLIDRNVLIEEPYHLSFPFCELNGNEIIPESFKAGKTFKYTINSSGTIITKEEVLDTGLIDAVCYTDKNGHEWVFASHEKNPKEDLYLYRKENNTFIIQNNGMPIMSSIEYTRGAGRFFEYKGQKYRPVQDSTGRYGRQTKIMRVDAIDNDGIDTTEVQTINSFQNPPFDETMHTFNVYDDIIIIDGSKDFVRFPMKLLYKKAKWLFKRRKG